MSHPNDTRADGDLPTEVAIISACLTDWHAAKPLLACVRPEHFPTLCWRVAFQAFLEADDARPGEQLSALSLTRALDRADLLSAAGGYEGLVALQDSVPNQLPILSDLAASLISAAAKAKVTTISGAMIGQLQSAATGGDITRGIFDAAISQLERSRDAFGAAPRDTLSSVSSALPDAITLFERRATGVEKPIPTAIPAWGESMAGGIWPGAHLLVAGTGFGKTQFALQHAMLAARHGIPTHYIGLELDSAQICARLLGLVSGVHWSDLYTGRGDCPITSGCIQSGIQLLKSLPHLTHEFGSPRGWAASQLLTRARTMRRISPTGPGLIVLDYLQLIGTEPGTEHEDLRERIGRAVMYARQAAADYGVAVILISSTARANYAALNSDIKNSGLSTVCNNYGTYRTLLHPDLLVGTGKESGESEYTADTVSVLVRWPTRLPSGDAVLIVTSPKVRWGRPTWVAMSWDGNKYHQLDVKTVDDLPELPTKKDSESNSTHLRHEEKLASLHDVVLQVVQECGPVGSKAIWEKVNDLGLCAQYKEVMTAVKGLAAEKAIEDMTYGKGVARQWKACDVSAEEAE